MLRPLRRTQEAPHDKLTVRTAVFQTREAIEQATTDALAAEATERTKRDRIAAARQDQEHIADEQARARGMEVNAILNRFGDPKCFPTTEVKR